jgi:soluble lytic murein transglycosylase-like protein
MRSVLLILLLAATCIPLSASATVYVYTLPDGSRLITDMKQKKKGYKLKKSYKTTPYRSNKQRKNAPYYALPIKSQYDALIVNTALQYDLEPSFVKAVVHIESAFDRYAVSPAGAMGLMQLMPGTAAIYSMTSNHFDPSKNIEVGVRHLRDLMDRYDQDKTLSLAAYNAGVGAVAKYQGVPPYDETVNYVEKVMSLYNKYKKII